MCLGPKYIYKVYQVFFCTTTTVSNTTARNIFSTTHKNMDLGAGVGGRVLLPLSLHASNTLLSISKMHPQSVLMVSPFCHEQPEGAHEVRGWCLDTPCSAPASSLPINCSMFDGVSIVKCECSQTEILQLLSNAEDTRKRLGDAISQIMQYTAFEETQHLRASWKRCRPMPNGVPQSLCSAVVVGQQGVDPAASASKQPQSRVSFFNTEDCVPLIDSEAWIPELSPDGFIGLYHHWNHDDQHARAAMNQHTLRSDLYSRTARGPSLYIVCQSYLPKACLEFADMVRDLGDCCTASEIHHSEEANWLRQACSRNRARLIAAVSREMGIKIPLMLDYSAAVCCDNTSSGFSSLHDALMKYKAIACIETLHHDMQSLSLKSLGANYHHHVDDDTTSATTNKELIRILNFCTPSSNTACIMAPWDGVWVFHGDSPIQEDAYSIVGSNNNSMGSTTKWSTRHHHEGSLFFPTLTPHIAEQDHHTLKQQSLSKRNSTTFLMFTSNVPQCCEVLNVFFKKQAAKKSSKRKTFKNAGKIQASISHDSAVAILGTLDELRLAIPTDPDSMKMLQTYSLSDLQNGKADPTSMMLSDSHSGNMDSNGVQDPDITAAYRRSIARMASLALNHHPNPTSSTTTSGGNGSNDGGFSSRQGKGANSKTKTFLSFNENVLSAMERQGWKRSSGYTALIPLACGLCDHWKRFFEEEEARQGVA
jgi:hypothetical protein